MSWWPSKHSSYHDTVKHSTNMAFDKPVALRLLSDDAPRELESTSAQKISSPPTIRRLRRPSEFLSSTPSPLHNGTQAGSFSEKELVSRRGGQRKRGPTWGANESLEERLARFSRQLESPSVSEPYVPQMKALGQRNLSSKPPRHDVSRKAVIEKTFSIEAPQVLLDDDLTLLSYGPSLAVALHDQLFFWSQDGKGNAELITRTENGAPISCVQWQNKPVIPSTFGESLIALGVEKDVELWSVEKGRVTQAFRGHHTGFVSAIFWKEDGTELLAGSMAGIKRHCLQNGNDIDENPNDFHYQDGHGGERITCLRWNDNDGIFVSAGNGVIQVWDATQRGEAIQPLWTFYHPGVKCVEFTPGKHRNILVSGGEGGLKFWNLRNGTLRSSIDVGQTQTSQNVVTDIVWSCRNELLASHGNCLSIWDPDQATKTSELQTSQGKILCMDQGPNGRMACIHEDEIVAGYSIAGRSRMAYQSRGSLRR